jgi:hypothetical protein
MPKRLLTVAVAALLYSTAIAQQETKLIHMDVEKELQHESVHDYFHKLQSEFVDVDMISS